jgi:transposase
MSTRKAKPTPSSATAQRKAHARRKARAHAKTAAARQAETAEINALPIRNRQAAGIDIGSRSHWVCVGFTTADPADLVREFPAHTDGLRALAAYLHEHEVTTVALESTGIYWIALYELLESEGLEVFLVDPSYTKQIKGRPKTDKRDAQWIYRLHSVGLLAAAFRPDGATCVLRSYLRQRANLIRYASQHIQHMHKALEQMNLKLHNVLSSLTGTTGQQIIRAILRGTRDPQKLAALRNYRCQATAAEIAQALTGSYRPEHLFALRQAFQAWQFYQQQLDAVDEQLRLQLEQMKTTRALPPLPPKTRVRGRKPNDPRFDVRAALYYVVGLDLLEIEGLDETTALVVLGELGTDLSKFATVKHFCSWLGLCPQWRKTGGQVKSSRTRPGLNRVAAALRLAAHSLHHSHSALGAYYRRQKSRLGAPQANTATAHKLARLVYYALTKGLPYVKQSQADYEAHLRAKQIESLKKKARRLGLEVQEKDTAGVDAACAPSSASP